MAGREGFEPSIPLPVCILSRDVVSATHPSALKKNVIVVYVL